MTASIRGSAEYRALTGALEHTKPACLNDWRFTIDAVDLHHVDKAQMRNVCRRCPLTDLCRTYATIARPKAGMWAGRHWGRIERSEES